MEDDRIPLLQLLLEFCLDEKDTLCVFQFGSRIFELNNKESDWDFVIVVKDETILEGSTKGYLERKKESRYGELNANIYKKKVFVEQLEENELQKLMCYFLEGKFVWKNQLCDLKIRLSKRKLCHQVLKEASRHFNSLATRAWKEKRDKRRALKMMFFGLRDLFFGIQLLERGTIYDYKQANFLWYTIQEEERGEEGRRKERREERGKGEEEGREGREKGEEREWEKIVKKWKREYETLKNSVQKLLNEKPNPQVYSSPKLTLINSPSFQTNPEHSKLKSLFTLLSLVESIGLDATFKIEKKQEGFEIEGERRKGHTEGIVYVGFGRGRKEDVGTSGYVGLDGRVKEENEKANLKVKEELVDLKVKEELVGGIDENFKGGLFFHFEIESREHPLQPKLIMLNFEKRYSRMDEKEVRWANGVVVELTWDKKVAKLVSLPFPYFPPSSKKHLLPPSFDWNSSSLSPFYEGIFFSLFKVEMNWTIATFSSQSIPNLPPSSPFSKNEFVCFFNLDKWEAFNPKFSGLTKVLNKLCTINQHSKNVATSSSFCFLFVLLLSQEDKKFVGLNEQLICCYKETSLKCLSIFNTNTFQEFTITSLPPFNFESKVDAQNQMPHFPLQFIPSLQSSIQQFKPEEITFQTEKKTLHQVEKLALQFSSVENKGIIVTDKHFNRIKVCSVQFESLSLLLSSSTSTPNSKSNEESSEDLLLTDLLLRNFQKNSFQHILSLLSPLQIKKVTAFNEKLVLLSKQVDEKFGVYFQDLKDEKQILKRIKMEELFFSSTLINMRKLGFKEFLSYIVTQPTLVLYSLFSAVH